MIKEFKEFAIKGNAIDLAVGVIIGAAFGKIVDSLVKDIIMPPLGLIAGKVDFSNLFVTLGGGRFETLAQAQAANAPTLNYGMFINNIINFVIIGFAVFLLVKQINRFKKREVAPPPNTMKCKFCIMDVSIDAVRCPHCTSQLTS